MNNDHLFTVTITPRGNDSDHYELFEVKFVGSEYLPGPRPIVTGQLRLIPIHGELTIMHVQSVEFENVAEDDKVQFALLIPDGFVKLWGLRGPTATTFSGDLARDIPFMWDVTSDFPSLAETRLVTPRFINEANANLAERGYHFRLAPSETIAIETPKEPQLLHAETVAEQIEHVAEAVKDEHETPPMTRVQLDHDARVQAAAEFHEQQQQRELSQEEPKLVKKMRISIEGKQAMIVGSSVEALGEAVTVDYRQRTNGDKFEVVAVEQLQTVGLKPRDGMGLAFAALSLGKRANPDLPVELGVSKPGLDSLSELIPELDEQTKWSSHLNVFLVNSDFVKQEVDRVAGMGYVAELTE